MTLGDIIKKYRIEHGISMDTFSEKSGISKSYISLLEKNKHPKTGKEIAPSIQCIKQASVGLNMDFDVLFGMLDGNITISDKSSKNPSTINVLGRVAAGIPLSAIEDIIDTEEISDELARTGEFFGLKIKGDSMEPRIYDGDVVIVRQQTDAESGDIVIAMVNGDDAVCKRLVKYSSSIALVSLNSKYEPMMFTNDDIESKPVRIIGKVVELRGKL